jgi:hypothetical protein
MKTRIIFGLLVLACVYVASYEAACTPSAHTFGAPAPIGKTDPRSTTYTNTGVMTPPSNGTWTQATWYQSYAPSGNSAGVAVGADTNDCLTSSTPCATVAEIQRRWGGVPVLPQATTINPLYTPTTAQMLADPWNIKAMVTQGGTLTIKGPLNTTTTICSGTLNTVTAKSRGTGVALQSTFTVTTQIDGGTCTIAAGQFAVNTSTADGGPTHNGGSWIHHLVTGSTWFLTEPLATVANPFLGVFPAEVDTWATTDPVTLYTPVGINLVSFDVQPTDPSVNALGMSNVTAYGQTLDVVLLDPQTTDAGYNVDPVVIGPYVHLLETWSQRPVVIGPNPGNGIVGIVNTVLAGGGSFASDHTNITGPVSTYFPTTAFFGGAIGSSTAVLNEFAGVILDGDVTISGTVNASNSSLGWAYIDASSKLNAEGLTDVVNHAVNGTSGVTAYDVWGPGTLNVAGSSKLIYPGGANNFVNTLGDGGPVWTMNGQKLVAFQKLDAGPGSYGLALTPALMDTNLGAVAGCALSTGGATACNTANP